MVSINYKKRLGEKLIVCTLRIHLASGAGYFFRSMVLELFVRFFGVYSSLVSRLSPDFSLSLLFISIPSVICISLCFIVFSIPSARYRCLPWFPLRVYLGCSRACVVSVLPSTMALHCIDTP